jgi:CRP-like cAMP-binding protein
MFQDLIRNFPEIEQKLVEQSRTYHDHWKIYQIQALEKIPYLSKIPYTVREDLHYSLQIENFESGAKIFLKGEECQALYFLVTGELDLVVEQEGKDFLVDSLKPGASLGAYSIFNETPFAYTAKAKGHVTLLTLSREDFLNQADFSEELTSAIEEASEFVLRNQIPQCDYTISYTQFKKERASLTAAQRLSQAIDKVITLNKKSEVKKLKIVELIKFIKEHQKKNGSFIIPVAQTPGFN